MDKILFIEDDSVFADSFMRKLQTAGYEVDLAKDVATALEALRKTKYSLVILDGVLPQANAADFLTQKHADAAIASVPVIMLTNPIQPVEASELGAMGVTQLLVKADVTPDQLLVRVRGILLTEFSAETASEPVPKNSLGQMKILLVEDDEFLGKILSTRLKAEHADVMYAKSGEEALEQLKTGVPQIALLDILLPGINGFEVLKHIRTDERMKMIPAIMISNFSQEANKQQAAALGADYLVKAVVNPDDIIAEILKFVHPGI